MNYLFNYPNIVSEHLAFIPFVLFAHRYTFITLSAYDITIMHYDKLLKQVYHFINVPDHIVENQFNSLNPAEAQHEFLMGRVTLVTLKSVQSVTPEMERIMHLQRIKTNTNKKLLCMH